MNIIRIIIRIIKVAEVENHVRIYLRTYKFCLFSHNIYYHFS